MADPDPPPSSATLTARCHCGLHTLPIPLPRSALPLPALYCHCTLCTHATGAPFVGHAQLPRACAPFASYAALPRTLSAYRASAGGGERVFCATCGTHVVVCWWDERGEEHWVVALGALALALELEPGDSDADSELKAEEAYRAAGHLFVGSTGDGGLARWVDDGLPKWAGWPSGGEYVFPAELGAWKRREDESGEEVLSGGCHCRGVRFEILRPGALPDGPGVKEQASPDGRRWATNACFCSDCRRSLGHLVPAHISVGRAHLRFLNQETLAVYESSPEKGTRRTFCKRCGACVSNVGGFGRNGWVDVHVGLVDVDTEKGEGVAGVLRSWTVWKDRFSFESEASDVGLRDALYRGMRKEGAITQARLLAGEQEEGAASV